jgi:uncharacterized protein YijF (DUF1287 family)
MRVNRGKYWILSFGCTFALLCVSGCRQELRIDTLSAAAVQEKAPVQENQVRPLPPSAPKPLIKLVEGAIDETNYTTGYDPAYVAIDYPGGDVPLDSGVCTDVVIRAFRKADVDLQKEVHEDMKAHFDAYPKLWGLSKTDTNIDHRRVPNLMAFFERKGKSVGVSSDAADYRPGDVVTWDLGNSLTHTGLVTNYWSTDSKRYMIVHNIGGGARVEDVLFSWRVTGHYRYF